MEIEKVVTENYWKGRQGWNIDGIVLHITDSTGKSAYNTFTNPASEVSAHYLIMEDGRIFQFVDEKDTAWHAGKKVNPTHPNIRSGVNPNRHTIGIECASKGGFPSIRQWLTWAKLVKCIARDNNIPINDTGLINHNEIRSNKTCPGRWFSKKWAKLLTKVV